MSDLNSSRRLRSGLRRVGVRLRRRRTPADSLAFALSALLSPYLVIPFGTVGIIYARAPREFWLWAAISLFFSTFCPLLYILIGMWRGVITDVHVMEREQRGGPFAVAILGGFLGAFLLYLLGAERSVWGLSVILSINGLVIHAITHFTKISVHVSVLSATVMGALILHPQLSPWAFLWMIPLLIWARSKRGRHSLWQGVSGFFVASAVTMFTIAGLGLSNNLTWLLHRLG